VTLGRLDRLEGYRENDLDRSMYHRVPIGAIDDETKTYYGEMYVGNPKYWHRSHYSECPNVDGLYEWSRGNSW
jgi:hypothetical protein